MKDTAKEMAKRLVIDSIWKSANLEGLGTTYPKTYAILANAPTNTRAEEVIFIINMKEAWQFLLDNLDCPNNLEILLEYNKIVGNLLFYDIFLPKKPVVNNIFNDMVNNKLVFSCEVFINDFRDILINSAAVVKSFIDNKYNDKNIVKVKSLVIV